jgi:hypothetical protein
MARSMVGLLAAVGAAMSALIGLIHGLLVWLVIVAAGLGTGLAAYLTMSASKKTLLMHYGRTSVDSRMLLGSLSAIPMCSAFGASPRTFVTWPSPSSGE